MRIAIYTRQPENASSIKLAHWSEALARNSFYELDRDPIICCSQAELSEHLSSVAIIISSRADIRDLITSNDSNLKMIFLAFAGVDHLSPFGWVPEGVPLVNNSGASSKAAGEYTIFALQLLANAVVQGTSRAFNSYAVERGFVSLAGRRVTIVGVGGVGGGVARICKSFRMEVVGVRRSGASDPAFNRMYSAKQIRDALSDSDFLVLACPVTKETIGMFDADLLARAKRGACLVNIARGAILDEQALCDAIESGALGGAVLDVVTSSGPDARVRNTPGILVTPHVSGDDALHYIDRTLDVFLANLRDLVCGREPKNRIDLALGY